MIHTVNSYRPSPSLGMLAAIARRAIVKNKMKPKTLKQSRVLKWKDGKKLQNDMGLN